MVLVCISSLEGLAMAVGNAAEQSEPRQPPPPSSNARGYLCCGLKMHEQRLSYHIEHVDGPFACDGERRAGHFDLEARLHLRERNGAGTDSTKKNL